MPKIAGHSPGETVRRRRRSQASPAAKYLLAASLLFTAAGWNEPAAAQTSAGSLSTDQLIDLLVKSHVLTRAQVNTMIQQSQAGGGTPARATAARTTRTGRAATAAAAPPPEPVVPPGTVRVTYVPEAVRQEIAASVKQQVMQEAQANGWAAPNVMPDWVQRIKISGDIRVRGEGDLFDKNNFNSFPDFNAINNSSNGFDINNTNGTNPNILNTTENRTRVQLRARLNVAAQVADWIDADIRVGTGNSNTPVSLNQTLGTPGDFSKYSLFLDRAYIKLHPIDGVVIYAGRSPNPFWTTDLLFDDDVGFDGVSAQLSHQFTPRIGAFLNAGAFPVFNTDFNFGTTNIEKTASRDAYLFAIQGGADWKFNDTTAGKIGVGYFDFSNVQGKELSPCFAPTSIGSCNTDDTKPGFLQFGNTLFPLRNIVQDPANPNGPVPEIFGLASRYDILNLRGQVTLTNFHPIDIVIDADYVRNLGFNRASIVNHAPVNNLGATTTAPFVGGDSGYAVTVKVGHQELEKLWDWNASVTYKYLESDAVLDALTDSDFHLGGTNAKGYILAGNLGIAHNAYLTARWLSTNQIAGQPYAVDVAQIDLNAKF